MGEESHSEGRENAHPPIIYCAGSEINHHHTDHPEYRGQNFGGDDQGIRSGNAGEEAYESGQVGQRISKAAVPGEWSGLTGHDLLRQPIEEVRINAQYEVMVAWEEM
ncbi:MAG: hypothetical protein DDT27_01196 [Dehalococcoidia bacterium]|nr:hypothetical protein [Chloroflexota bacterium]